MIKKRFTWKTEIDLLNSIIEENKELKKENEQLRHEIEIEKKWQLEKDKYYVKINKMLKNEDYDMNLLKEFVLFYKEFDGYENSYELRESELNLIDLFLGERYE